MWKKFGDIVYTVEGDPKGPARICINGMMTQASIWRQTMHACIQAGDCVVLYDLRAQGRSSGDPMTTWEGHLKDLLGLMDHLGIQQADLVGTSFGAQLSLRMALMEPARIRSLVLFGVLAQTNSFFNKTTSHWLDLLAHRSLADAVTEMMPDLYYSKQQVQMLLSPLYLKQLNQHPTLRQAMMTMIRDTPNLMVAPDILHRICCPALVVAMEHDVVMSPKAVQLVAQAMPQATYRCIAGCGHAVLIEAPKKAAALVAEWFQRTDQ